MLNGLGRRSPGARRRAPTFSVRGAATHEAPHTTVLTDLDDPVARELVAAVSQREASSPR